jgi:hypothetical protein
MNATVRPIYFKFEFLHDFPTPPEPKITNFAVPSLMLLTRNYFKNNWLVVFGQSYKIFVF